MTDTTWLVLSNQTLTAAGLLYALALLAGSWQWSRRVSAADPGEGRAAMMAKLSEVLTLMGAGVHLVALVARGMSADPNRVPWGNMYEFTISGTFALVAAFVVVRRREGWDWLAPLVLGLSVVLLMSAALNLYQPTGPLVEALESPWLVVHVFAAVLATGVFALGGLISIIYLVKARVGPERLGWIRTDLATLDRTAYQLHAFGFPVWTFAVLIAGPIWAHEAWGSYWNWDAKEVWAFITWVVYAAYLHARSTASWRGKPAALLAVVGLATLMFNFIWVNYVSTNSVHSYASSPGQTSRVVADERG